MIKQRQKVFFEQAQKTTGIMPVQITTDNEAALYLAIETIVGATTKHRAIKSRLRVMKGFKNIFCELIFCTVFEGIWQFLHMKNKTRAEHRCLITPKFQAFNNLLNCTA